MFLSYISFHFSKQAQNITSCPRRSLVCTGHVLIARLGVGHDMLECWGHQSQVSAKCRFTSSLKEQVMKRFKALRKLAKAGCWFISHWFNKLTDLRLALLSSLPAERLLKGGVCVCDFFFYLKNVTKNCTRSMMLLCCEKAICNGTANKRFSLDIHRTVKLFGPTHDIVLKESN